MKETVMDASNLNDAHKMKTTELIPVIIFLENLESKY